MQNSIRITMFGGFRIELDGMPIMPSLRQAAKTRALIEYLIFRAGMPVSQDELVEALWEHGSGGANPHSALRTMLHRLRTLAEESGAPQLKKAIITERGAYRWDTEAGCAVDLLQFEALGEKLASPGLTNREKEQFIKEMLAIYRGPLLPESAETRWISQRSISCHDLYMDAVFSYLELLKLEQRYGEVCEVCRSAMNIDLFDERLHTELVNALMHSGKNREALAQYYAASDTMMRRFGAAPSEKAREAFRDIARADLRAAEELDEVCRELQQAECRQPLFCDYQLLLAVYREQSRMIGGDTFSVCSFSIGGSETDAFRLEEARRCFEQIALGLLRPSDTLARYDTRRYVALLANRSPSEAEQLAAEVAEQFTKKAPLPLGLKFRVRGFDRPEPSGETAIKAE